MAHYAFLDKNNVVTEVITGIDETETIEGLDTETWYGNLRNQKCVRTSYNSKIRGTYAGIGFTYNQDEDLFVLPQPFPSWIRSGSFWNPPITKPNDDKFYSWDEENLKWVEIETLAE
jgi:hypothetical protein